MGYFMDKVHFVYKTTNRLNGHFYYGVHSTTNIDDGYLGSGKRLQSAIAKYGRDAFDRIIIRQFDTANEAFEFEKHTITEDLLQDPSCYNLRSGGHGGHCDRSRELVSQGRRLHFDEDGPSPAELNMYAARTERYRRGEWTDNERARHQSMSLLIADMTWYTNGTQNTRAIDPPGPDWWPGRSMSSGCDQQQFIALYQSCGARSAFIDALSPTLSTTAASSLYYRIKKQLNEVATQK